MTVEEAVTAAEQAASWDARVAVIRQVPEQFGTAALGEGTVQPFPALVHIRP
jgi:predicted Zn-dependent protease